MVAEVSGEIYSKKCDENGIEKDVITSQSKGERRERERGDDIVHFSRCISVTSIMNEHTHTNNYKHALVISKHALNFNVISLSRQHFQLSGVSCLS